jgi:hypothetical protein
VLEQLIQLQRARLHPNGVAQMGIGRRTQKRLDLATTLEGRASEAYALQDWAPRNSTASPSALQSQTS